MMTLFSRAYIESILSFSLVAWFPHLSIQSLNPLNQIVRWASNLIGEDQLSLSAIYISQLQRKARAVVRDSSHPLHVQFQLLPHGVRYDAPVWNRVR